MSEQPEQWASDDFAVANLKLWLAIAEKAELAAHEAGEIVAVIRWAQLAETAYWQATGEGDCHSLNSLVADIAKAPNTGDGQ